MTESIAQDFKYGANLEMGEYVIIEPNVIVGNNVKIGHRATLKSGTIIGDNSIIDDHCITTGACYIGNNVNIRTGAIISRATIIEDYCFIGPGVITNHTKQVTHGRTENVPDVQLLTYIGYGTVIGSQASILAGVYIRPQTIIGGGTVVIKDLTEMGVYVGSPAVKKMDVPDNYLMHMPDNAGSMYLNNNVFEHFKSYMESLQLPEIK